MATNPTSTCAVCGGSGWKNVPADPAKGRKRDAVVRCNCHASSVLDKRTDAAGIPPRYKDRTFSTFHDVHSNSAASTRSVNWARTQVEYFVDRYTPNSKGLLLVGSSGLGKTHLAVACLHELISKGFDGLFCDYRELLKQIQHSYSPEVHATELQILGPLFHAELLVLDDLGAVRPSEWVWDTVSLILNSRYNEKKTTLITTNYPFLPASTQSNPVNLSAERQSLGDRIGNRMLSRLSEMCKVIEMEGSDYRLAFKGERQ